MGDTEQTSYKGGIGYRIFQKNASRFQKIPLRIRLKHPNPEIVHRASRKFIWLGLADR